MENAYGRTAAGRREVSFFFLFFLRDEMKRGRRKERAAWSKQLSRLAPVQVGAVTQTVNSISPFILGGLSGSSTAQVDAELGQQSEKKKGVGGVGGIISKQ